MRPDGLMTRTTATAVCQQWYHGIKHNMKLKNDQIFTHFEESIAKLSDCGIFNRKQLLAGAVLGLEFDSFFVRS